MDSSEDSTAYRTEDDIEIPSNMGPSQSQIVMATEQITKKIQELLQAAQGGRNSKYVEFFDFVFVLGSLNYYFIFHYHIW